MEEMVTQGSLERIMEMFLKELQRVYPAPGGNSWSGNGVNGPDGTAVWEYSGFNTGGVSSLYFGLNQTSYGTLGARLHGAADPFTSIGVSGTTATWSGTTTWKIHNSPSDQHILVNTRLLMTITGLGANPWIEDLASIGLDTFGFLGAVVDNSAGQDFTLQWAIQADVGNGWQAINSVQQAWDHNGMTRSSFATGFYYEPAQSVPEPGTLAMLALGFVAVGTRRR